MQYRGGSEIRSDWRSGSRVAFHPDHADFAQRTPERV